MLEQFPARHEQPRRNRGRLALLAVALLVVLAAQAALFGLVRPYLSRGPSMEPTILCEAPVTGCTGKTTDRVLVVRYVLRDPRRGDIVAFRATPEIRRLCGADGTFLRRVVGVAGETVTYSAERGVSVDGDALAEPYVTADREGGPEGTWRVARGGYFVVGDNRRLSCDSRVWGALERGDILGRVAATYWPPRRVGLR